MRLWPIVFLAFSCQPRTETAASLNSDDNQQPLAILAFQYSAKEDGFSGHKITKENLKRYGYRVLDLSNQSNGNLQKLVAADRASRELSYSDGQTIYVIVGGEHGLPVQGKDGRPSQAVMRTLESGSPRFYNAVEEFILPIAKGAGVSASGGPNLSILATQCFSGLVPNELSRRQDLKQAFGSKLGATSTSPADAQGVGDDGADQGISAFLLVSAPSSTLPKEIDSGGNNDGVVTQSEYASYFAQPSMQLGFFQANYLSEAPMVDGKPGKPDLIHIGPNWQRTFRDKKPAEGRHFLFPQKISAGGSDQVMFPPVEGEGPNQELSSAKPIHYKFQEDLASRALADDRDQGIASELIKTLPNLDAAKSPRTLTEINQNQPPPQ